MLIREKKRRLVERHKRLHQNYHNWALNYAGRPVEFIGELMGPEWFGPDWAAWRVFVKVLFGLPLYSIELDIYTLCTGLTTYVPGHSHRNAWVPVGRRGGKSRTLAMIAVYLACCFEYRRYLAPGEIGYISVLADQRDHAQAIMNYIKGALRHPKLAGLVGRQLVETVELVTRVTIEVVTASIKAVRSRTVIAALCVAKGTLIETEAGPRSVETVRAGDLVWTRGGLRRVLRAGMTHPEAEVRQVSFSNGRSLLATPDHPVFVVQKGFVALNSLSHGNEIVGWTNFARTAAFGLGDGLSDVNHAPHWFARNYVLACYHRLTALISSNGVAGGGTSAERTGTTETVAESYCTGTFMRRSTALFHRVSRWWFTTRTTIERTFRSITSGASLQVSTWSSMAFEVSPLGVLVTHVTRLAPVLSGIIENLSSGPAPSAATRSGRRGCAASIVVTSVDAVLERVAVYNLQVEDTPEYFANGILVHNCDEIAFWQADEDCANPDTEILNGLRPAMITIPNSLLLAASSRYARRGALWNNYRDWYGKPEGPLVWSADTKTMHPGVDQAFLDSEYEKDPLAAAAEYGLEFRSDVAAYIDPDAVKACTVPGRFELPALPRPQVYAAFVDPAGGSGGDSMTLAVAHADGDRGVLDLLREVRPPFDPDTAVREFVEALKPYRLGQVRGDRYGGDWVSARFEEYGIRYEVSELTKSEIYREFLPLVNATRVDLLDHKRMLMQLSLLERRTARGGRDSVDHPPSGHDDLINVAAGALVIVSDTSSQPIVISAEALRRARGGR